jgi:uncharacterized protein YegL
MASLISTENNNTEMKIPEHLICPISGTLFKEPVLAPDGYTYEKSLIVEWLKNNNTSPFTRQLMSISDLTVNRSVKEAVETFLKENSNVKIKSTGSSISSDYILNVGSSRFVKLEDKKAFYEFTLSNLNKDKTLKPLDIGILVDVSGSMGCEVSPNNSTGNETINVSRLDLTKHAIKSLIRSLPVNTRITLVTFSTSVSIKLDINMGLITNEVRRKHLLNVVDQLETEGQTMIESGVNTIIDVMSKDFKQDRSSVIFVFTDGEPSNEVNYVKRSFDIKKKSNPYLIPIHTFGFGYQLKSELLNYISAETNGSYSFIPEAGMLATIFNNRLANVLTNIVDQGRVVIDLSSLYQKEITINIDTFKCSYPYALVGSNLIINIGSLQCDCDKYVSFSFDLETSKASVVDDLNKNIKIILDDTEISILSDCENQSVKNSARETYISFLKNIISKWYENLDYGIESDLSVFNNQIPNLVSNLVQISNSTSDKNEKIYIGGLIKDLNGEVKESLKNLTDFKRWGIHYLPSLLNAHIHQVNNNFRDPGVQFYGGEKFSEIRDHAVSQFNKHDIEVSRPSAGYRGGRAYSGSYRGAPRNNGVSSIRTPSAVYNVSSGPCFSPDSKVLMADKSIKLVQNIRKNDQIYVSNGCKAKVVCVIHNKGFTKYSTFPTGLKITPWHPVLIDGKWKFPENIYKSKYEGINESYNFILDSGHMMNINSVTCCTLGHGFSDNEVIRHEFFGTNEVIKSLRNADPIGFLVGYINFTNLEFQRSLETGKVIGIKNSTINLFENWDNKKVNFYESDKRDFIEVTNASLLKSY